MGTAHLSAAEPQGAFRVRPARRGDAEGISRLMNEAGFEKGGDAQTVHWLVSHPEIELFVAADRADRVVGLVSMSHRPQLRQSGRIATIEELVVTHEWRRRGVGRALLKHAVERAQVLSVKSLQLQAPLDNPLEMAAFCRACGFVPDPVGVYLWAPDRA